MKKTILVSNQRCKECIDILNVYNIVESNATIKNFESIDNLWLEIENDYVAKFNKQLYEDDLIIHIEIDMCDDEFKLISYKMLTYDEPKDELNVDLYHFNGYI